MTVRELIKALSEYNPDLEIKAPANEFAFNRRGCGSAFGRICRNSC